MKIAIGLIKHESNSFNPELTTSDDFNILEGSEILENQGLLEHSCLGGMYDFFQKQGLEVVPLIAAVPKHLGGLIAKETYREIKNLFLEKVDSCSSLDGVCLDLHGSMTVEGGKDAEGDLLATLKGKIGTGVPVTAALDLHAMVTSKMVKHADGFVGYRTAPHVDKFETGIKAAKLLYHSLKNNYSLEMAAVPVPLLVSGEKSETEVRPMKSLIEKLEETDQQEAVLSSSYFLGFPWVDVEFNHCTSLVVTRNNKGFARKEAVELAENFWSEHQNFNFTTETYEMEEALEKASLEDRKPVYICDCGDNPGAGGSQNMACTLDLMRKKEPGRSLLGVIVDREAYEECQNREPGEKIELALGRYSVQQENPLMVQARFKCAGQWRGVNAAVIEVNQIDVVVTTERVTLVDPEFFINLGLDLEEYEIVVLKGGYLAPKFRERASKVLFGLATGYTHQIFTELNYEQVSRPIYPLDQDFSFNPEENIIKN